MNECWYKSNEIFASLVFTKSTERQLLQIYWLRVCSITELVMDWVPQTYHSWFWMYTTYIGGNMLKASRQEDFSSVFAKYDGFFFQIVFNSFLGGF